MRPMMAAVKETRSRQVRGSERLPLPLSLYSFININLKQLLLFYLK